MLARSKICMGVVGQVLCCTTSRWRQDYIRLSPFLLDRLIDDIRLALPWTVMFADDIVIFKSRVLVEENLEECRCVLKRRGMMVSQN